MNFKMFFIRWAKAGYFFKDFSFYLIIDLIFLILAAYLFLKIYKSNFGEKVKKIYLVLVALSLGFILTFSAFEAYFRYVYDQLDGLGFLRVNSKWQ